MEIPVLVQSLKSSILSSTSSQLDNTFLGVVSAAVEQSRSNANMVAQGDGKFGPSCWPQNPTKPKKCKKKCIGRAIEACSDSYYILSQWLAS